jgi:hypothetical protein
MGQVKVGVQGESGEGKQILFNNFFANPDDDIRDIYNDSSGTNNSNSLNAVNMKAAAIKNQKLF